MQKYSGPAKPSRGQWIFLHGLLDSNAREERVGVARERRAKRPLLLACDVLDLSKSFPFHRLVASLVGSLPLAFETHRT